MNFQNIFTHGNLVDINVSVWSAEKRLTPEDLGINEDKVPDAFTLGRKKLMPREVIAEFKHLDYKARSTLAKYSFQFEFGQARFVPKKIFMDFVDEIEAIKIDFYAKVDSFIQKYEGYKIEMRKEYVNAAHEAYNRSSLLCGFDQDEDTFVNKFLERVDSFYPSVNEIRRRFSMEYIPFTVSLPDLSQASYEDVAEEDAKLRLMQEAYRKSLYNKVCSFVDKIVGGLREKASKVLGEVIETVKEGKRFNEATLNKVRKMIDEFEKMNICGDTVFEAQLTEFRDKFLNNCDAKMVREDAVLRDNLYKELKILVEVATDEAAITALASNYRDKINL